MVENGVMTALFFRILAFYMGVAAIPMCMASGQQLVGSHQAVPTPVTISQFSGKPLPRFESLRYSAVHGRQGPSLEHEILWRYERAGLPMLVVRETHGWSRVRDKDGDEVWVQSRMLSAQQTVFVLREAILRRRPEQDAAGRATLKQGAVADLLGCEQAWCEVKAGRYRGWLDQSQLWGVETETGNL